jgi:hypothetical protein
LNKANSVGQIGFVTFAASAAVGSARNGANAPAAVKMSGRFIRMA